MYNSCNRVCKRVKYIDRVKKRLVWACLKGVTLSKTFKEESNHKNHYDGNYSASITRCSLLRLNTYQFPDSSSQYGGCTMVSYIIALQDSPVLQRNNVLNDLPNVSKLASSFKYLPYLIPLNKFIPIIANMKYNNNNIIPTFTKEGIEKINVLNNVSTKATQEQCCCNRKRKV